MDRKAMDSTATSLLSFTVDERIAIILSALNMEEKKQLNEFLKKMGGQR